LFRLSLFVLLLFSGCSAGSVKTRYCSDVGDCVADQVCKLNRCVSANSGKQKNNNEKSSCQSNDDCQEGTWCTDEGCSPSKDIACSQNEDCPPDSNCDTSKGTCSLPKGNNNQSNKCHKNSDCKSGEECSQSNQCERKTDGSCKTEGDCRSGEYCYQGAGKCKALPEKVKIQIEGAVIAPGKEDGTQWDAGFFGAKKVPAGVIKGILTAATGISGGTAAIIAPILSKMSESAIEALKKPDVTGTATLIFPKGFESVHLSKIQDSFTPKWTDSGWSNVSFTSDLKVRVSLEDSDLRLNDPIGDAILTYKHFLAALKSGEIYFVQVLGQTSNQAVFISISVSSE